MRDRKCALNHDAIFGTRKPESLGYRVVLFVIRRLAVLVELRLVTDGRADTDRHGQTQAHG